MSAKTRAIEHVMDANTNMQDARKHLATVFVKIDRATEQMRKATEEMETLTAATLRRVS